MRLLTALAEIYNPDQRLDRVVESELGADGWEISRTTSVDSDALAGVDAMLVMMLPVPSEAIVRADSLRLIQAASRGYDAIDIEAAARRGIPVCNVHTAGHADTVAEHTFALLLAVAKQVPAGHAGIVSGGWPAPALVGAGLSELVGKTIGLVGLGEIGKQVARRADAFGMHLVYADEVADAVLECRYGMRRVSLDDLLTVSDVVSLHVPLTEATAGLIGGRELALMKPRAIVVNTSRGPVVDLDALASALHDGRVRAGLDVFDPEPPPAGHPILSAPGLVCSPHIGGVTTEMVERVLRDGVQNLRRLQRGEPIRHVVNGVSP
ncbi:MAG: phosphoglycerate dehydrogenase [Thermoleophilia bacterium]|nr:phosphoglycerate dehydrogenase [Thermoleophilia bacterium]MDH5333241.1 phosphoglycerate dehydrogenase [Thermoleophilia bacterium]